MTAEGERTRFSRWLVWGALFSLLLLIGSVAAADAADLGWENRGWFVALAFPFVFGSWVIFAVCAFKRTTGVALVCTALIPVFGVGALMLLGGAFSYAHAGSRWEMAFYDEEKRRTAARYR